VLTGKTSPRLVKDLLDYDPRKREHRGGKNLLADQAEKEIDDETTFVRRGENDCRHKLKKNSDRCVSPETKDVLPDASSYFVVSTICVECHYYFDILVDYKGWKAGQTPCKLSDKDNPLHHFQLVDTIYAKDQPERLSTPKSKYNPIIEEHHFCCSQTNCPIHVQINISAPRLKINLLAPILDSFKVRERGLRQIQHEPNRFVGLEPVSPFQALGFLRQYVSDAKNAQLMDTLPRKIAKRNKKFALSFGSECEELFEYLEFETVIEDPDVEVSRSSMFAFILNIMIDDKDQPYTLTTFCHETSLS
jgi:ubiquitin carboxyl-terminal hydrolase 25/28